MLLDMSERRLAGEDRGIGMARVRRGGVTYLSQGDILRHRQMVGLALGVRNVCFHEDRAENEDIGLNRLERGYKQKGTLYALVFISIKECFTSRESSPVRLALLLRYSAHESVVGEGAGRLHIEDCCL